MQRNTDYGYTRPVSGSAAYDYSYFETYEDKFYELITDSNVVELEKTQTQAAPRAKPLVAPAAVLGFLFAAVLLVLSLLSQIQLTAVSDGNAALQKQLTELELENSRLLIQHEIAFNFAEIEKYAIGELGMQKPLEGQVFYLYGSSPDKTVILSAKNDSIIDRFSDTIASVADILR